MRPNEPSDNMTICPDWRALNDGWEKSGLSQQKFCEGQGIKLSVFSYHRHRLINKKKLKSVSRLAPITVRAAEYPEKGPLERIKILLSSGTQLSLPVDIPHATLTLLLKELDLQ